MQYPRNNLLRTTATGMLSLAILVGKGSAQNQPSAKATAQIGSINVIDQLSVTTNSSAAVTGTWVNILRNRLKTPNQKDVFIGVSLEVGLLTSTTAASKNGTSDTSMA